MSKHQEVIFSSATWQLLTQVTVFTGWFIIPCGCLMPPLISTQCENWSREPSYEQRSRNGSRKILPPLMRSEEVLRTIVTQWNLEISCIVAESRLGQFAPVRENCFVLVIECFRNYISDPTFERCIQRKYRI